MVKSLVLSNDVIIESWALVIEGAQSHAGKIYRTTAAYILESQIPHVRLERVNIRPRLLLGIFDLDQPREHLMITNHKLNDYRIYIAARSYGLNLDVAWFLTSESDFFNSLLSGSELHLFDQQDLRVHTTVVHRCLLKAVEEVMLGLGQDLSKVDRKSRGFLGVS